MCIKFSESGHLGDQNIKGEENIETDHKEVEKMLSGLS
jgi:hypothetical protein